jgi:8-oxo-dGTP pyrophosphatase MutT (NUDIX family)
MFIKVYFNDKPLFLCDAIDPVIAAYRHHPDAVFIDRFSPDTVRSMIHDMDQGRLHAGVFMHTNLADLKKAFWERFTVIQAAGGWVSNPQEETLFIFRRGKWDLPKGKLDEGETLAQCALREVEEETGLKNIVLQKALISTYHTYWEKSSFILKETYWYSMHINHAQTLVPQTEEDIAEARWVKGDQLVGLLSNTFPSIKDVMAAAIPASESSY